MYDSFFLFPPPPQFLGMQVVSDGDDAKGCMRALKALERSRLAKKHRVLLTIGLKRVHLVQYPWVSPGA